MLAAIRDLKHECRRFAHDAPGCRFANHRERMREKSRLHGIVVLALGVLLLAVGFVLLFIPGPGFLLIVFGLALVATHSERLSGVLDRVEPRLRAGAHRLVHRWRAMSRVSKAALITSSAAVACAACVAMWLVVSTLVA